MRFLPFDMRGDVLRAVRPEDLLLLTALAFSSACGDDISSPTGGSGGGGSGGSGATGGSGGAGGGYTGPCTPLTLGDTSIFFQSIARSGLVARVDPLIPEVAKTRLTMELYEDDGSGTLGPLVTGSFPFATAPDDNYGTCQHCMLLVGYDASGQPVRAFYPKNGEMRLETLDPDNTSILVGSIEQSELVEVTQNEDLTWSVLPNGTCYYLESWAFDTQPNDGASCTSAEECANELSQVCDPKSGKCAPPGCSLTGDGPFCAEGELCLSQLFDPDEEPSGPAIAACYVECDPASDNCGDGAICRPLGPTQETGVCMTSGTRALGEACVPRDNSTECSGGAVCWGEPGACIEICTYLTTDSGCGPGTFCTVSNLCKPSSEGDAAPIGDVCASDARLLEACGIEGDAFRGLCINFFPDDLQTRCERTCRTANPDCPGSETCLSLFSNPSVGICRLPAVCGDGFVDVIGGEVCDDDNAVGGDGCAADCRTAELGPLCALATPLELDMDIGGDTSNGPRGYPSTCDPYIAIPVRTFSFLPPAPGKLKLELTSGADLGLSVLSDCADGESTVACQNLFGDDILFVNVPTVPITPLLVTVRGNNPNVAGFFGLRASYVPAVCGDGLVGGPEACDDANTIGGDGCSADCTTIEWPTVCANLPTLATNVTTNGTTVGGTAYFDTSQICTFQSGKERAFAFIAPANGELTVSATQATADFAIYVQDGCGPVTGADGVSCGNSAFGGQTETTTALLTAGQRVTVIIDGFTASDEGPFALDATFTPN